MMDTPERALKEAEAWLVSAKDRLIEAEEDEALAGVCCALAIHAIIRANDALALYHFKVKATRHDDLPTIFEKLVREKKLSESDRSFRDLLAKAARDKSGADYGKKQFTVKEAEAYVAGAEEFVSTVKDRIAL